MPGPWIYFKENGDFFNDFKVEKGDYYESHQYDPSKQPQGFALWQVRSLIEANKDGIWINARLVAVSDSHLHWWLQSGPGKDEGRKFALHLCAKDFAHCRRGRGRGSMEFHSDHFRVLSTQDVADLRVSWFKEKTAKEDMKAEVGKMMGQDKDPTRRGGGKRPLADSSSDKEGDGTPAEAEHPAGSGTVADDLKKLRAEVGREKKPEGDKQETPRRRRERPRLEERGKQVENEKEKKSKRDVEKPKRKGNWFGARHEPQHSASESMDTRSDDTPRRAKKKRKKRRKAKQADRGPFGVGKRVKFGDETSEGSKDSRSEGSDQVFQAAPSDKSRQLQLIEYSQKDPGRLASRLLKKMQELLAREEGALNPTGQNQTPATATSYFLTVVTLGSWGQ